MLKAIKLRATSALWLPLIICLGLYGCSSEDDRPQDMTEKELYAEAQKNIKDDNYRLAVRNLQLLEARFPFGPYGEQAQLELIYAHFKSTEYEATVAAAERFIRLHPQHPNVDYAYYMKGLSNYSQGEGFLGRFLPTDPTDRDPGPALDSFEDFRQLLYRFPESPYAADARARMIYLRARLARYELNVANYYFERGAYMAAAARGRYVVENFPQTPANADALAVLVQAYHLLGMDDLAGNTLEVLRLNYPDHPSIDENGEFISKFSESDDDKSLLNILSFGLLDRNEPPKFDNRADYLVR